MLSKRDPIFWAATGIFVVSLVLGMAVDNAFLLLMVAAYLLRPTLHSLGFAKQLVDERQLQIQYQASNVAFAAMVVGNIVLMLYLMGRNDHTWEMINAVLLIGLAVRALAGLLMVGDPAVAGPRIVIAVGLFLCLFGVLEGGASGAVAHGVPGLVVVGLGFASRRAPRAIAVSLFALAALLLGWRAFSALQRHAVPNWGEILAVVFIAAPLVIAAFCLLRGASGSAIKGSSTPEEAATTPGVVRR
ncbi:MAG: hypothetical protein B7Z72_00090 [Gemmatimonadetes bacterium 21-71-4]|nr:MAG: hypothetical protein B7Z72_00090 [Gemmatimonadetes bacterium 21-71-4]